MSAISLTFTRKKSMLRIIGAVIAWMEILLVAYCLYVTWGLRISQKSFCTYSCSTMAKLSKSWDALNNTRSIKGAGLPSLPCWILGGCGFSMQPVHLQLHGFCLGSVAGEVAPKKEAAMSSIRGLTDQVFHSLNVKVCTFQSNFVALNGQ